MVTNEKSGVSGAWYLLGGAAVGAVLGLLFAPKKGEELREDIMELGREYGEQGSSLIARARERFTRAAPAGVSRSVNAAKSRAQEALIEAREKVSNRA